MKSARAAPRKHIVSARIKPPSESSSEGNRGFKYHLWKAIKRTVLNVLLVVILFVVLFFTDGFWLCESPFQISPINLSGISFLIKESNGIEFLSSLIETKNHL